MGHAVSIRDLRELLCQGKPVFQIAAGEVHGYWQKPVALGNPPCHHGAHPLEDPHVDSLHKAVALEEGNKLVRHDEPELGMVPANQGLCPADDASAQDNLGLEEDVEVPLLQTLRHAALDAVPAPGPLHVLLVKEPVVDEVAKGHGSPFPGQIRMVLDDCKVRHFFCYRTDAHTHGKAAVAPCSLPGPEFPDGGLHGPVE